eukprot:GHVS01017547.1.p1 GENE.GHVS01017547.1~~GHVS01017547.1.p1  ORF type:complete len:676 (+),score=63.15 GHVS01017547.1:1075-3102(+)
MRNGCMFLDDDLKSILKDIIAEEEGKCQQLLIDARTEATNALLLVAKAGAKDYQESYDGVEDVADLSQEIRNIKGLALALTDFAKVDVSKDGSLASTMDNIAAIHRLLETTRTLGKTFMSVLTGVLNTTAAEVAEKINTSMQTCKGYIKKGLAEKGRFKIMEEIKHAQRTSVALIHKMTKNWRFPTETDIDDFQSNGEIFENLHNQMRQWKNDVDVSPNSCDMDSAMKQFETLDSLTAEAPSLPSRAFGPVVSLTVESGISATTTGGKDRSSEKIGVPKLLLMAVASVYEAGHVKCWEDAEFVGRIRKSLTEAYNFANDTSLPSSFSDFEQKCQNHLRVIGPSPESAKGINATIFKLFSKVRGDVTTKLLLRFNDNIVRQLRGYEITLPDGLCTEQLGSMTEMLNRLMVHAANVRDKALEPIWGDMKTTVKEWLIARFKDIDRQVKTDGVPVDTKILWAAWFLRLRSEPNDKTKSLQPVYSALKRINISKVLPLPLLPLRLPLPLPMPNGKICEQLIRFYWQLWRSQIGHTTLEQLHKAYEATKKKKKNGTQHGRGGAAQGTSTPEEVQLGEIASLLRTYMFASTRRTDPKLVRDIADMLEDALDESMQEPKIYTGPNFEEWWNNIIQNSRVTVAAKIKDKLIDLANEVTGGLSWFGEASTVLPPLRHRIKVFRP